MSNKLSSFYENRTNNMSNLCLEKFLLGNKKENYPVTFLGFSNKTGHIRYIYKVLFAHNILQYAELLLVKV